MNEKIEIDEKIAQKIMSWIIIQEANNLSSKEKSDSAMIEAIQKKIEKEV